MSRQRSKGTRFESQVVEYLSRMLPFLDITRAPMKGAKDEGDIRGFTIYGLKCVLECKNHNRLELSAWIDEAERERGNADADFSFVIFKRRGYGDANMGGTYVLATLETLAALSAGSRELLGGDE